MNDPGYPASVLALVLAVGLPLALMRPYWAFLLAAFLLAGRNTPAFIYTRSAILGPYFNLNDACFVVAIAAVIVEIRRGIIKPRIPGIVVLVLLAVGTAAVQSLVRFGWTYDTLRATRWAITFPLLFVLAANCVTDGPRARLLIWALLLGGLASALQHLLYVTGVASLHGGEVEDVAEVRSIAFQGPGQWFLLAALVWGLPKQSWKKAACLGLGCLFLTSVILNQTRSIWLSSLGAVPLIFLMFPGPGNLKRLVGIGILPLALAAGTAGLLRWMLPGLDPAGVVIGRLATLQETDPEKAATGTRMRQLEYELKAWSEGTLLFGRGLSFFQKDYQEERAHRTLGQEIAYGHLGYVTYLSQLGLAGLLVYGFWLPGTLLRDARRVWRNHPAPAVRYLALLSASCIIAVSICFMMSSSLLQESYPVAGILGGAAWALARSLEAPAGVRLLWLRRRDESAAPAAPVPAMVPLRVVRHG